MTQFMSYIQQKKKVEDKYNPDTFRVISEDALCSHPKYQPRFYRSSFEPRSPSPASLQWNNNADDVENICLAKLKTTQVLPPLLPDFRANNPHPLSCGFLDKNVRLLNEPICNVYTGPVHHEEKYWWPARSNPGEPFIPPFTENTHYRIDYNCRHGNRPAGTGRYTANGIREPALGAIPVNYLRERDGTQKFFKEGLSYEHIYNSRADPNYPIRGKRHGAFVWKKLDPVSQKKFTEYYERLAQEERRAKEHVQKSQFSNENEVRVIRSINHKVSPEQSSPKDK